MSMSQELRSVQQKSLEVEQNSSKKITIELERKHEYQIQRMYSQISQIENKYKQEISSLNQKCSQLQQ